jgi:hypothetical protein
MEELSKIIKCACKSPHECCDDCLYCKTNYEFILETPIPLECGHCICQNCEIKIASNKDLKCIFCNSSIKKEKNLQKVFEAMFNSCNKINLQINNEKLQKKIRDIEGNKRK